METITGEKGGNLCIYVYKIVLFNFSCIMLVYLLKTPVLQFAVVSYISFDLLK
jgi:hypothetical protein